MTKNTKIKESAATGAVSAHSVAVKPDAEGSSPHPMQRRGGLLAFLSSYRKKKYGNSFDMQPVETPFKISVNENVSLDQIYSKLSGIENTARQDDTDSVTYGVEDDNKNLMKVTVRTDQAEDFEVALAQELGEIEEYNMTGRGGYGRNVSMAEVLFNLKQKFDVVDVEFPEIPKDRVYNADKVSNPDDLESKFDVDDDEFGDKEREDDLDMEGEDDEMGDTGEDGEDFDFDADLDSEDGGEDEDDDMDADVGEELGAEDEDDEESMLKQIVRMMSAEAEARKAQYEAEAEKSKAQQAEYSMKAAQEEMHKQEELLQMEDELNKQKDKEKEAKKLADLARYRLRGSVSESNSKSFLSVLSEISDIEDQSSLRMQRRNIRNIEDPRERALQMQILNSKRRILQRRKGLEREQQQDDQQEMDQEDDQQDQNRQRRNNPVPNRPMGGA